MGLDNTHDLLERYGFQQIFLEKMVNKNHFIEGKNNDYDLPFAIDKKQLFDFLETSQKKEFDKVSSRTNFEYDFEKYLREEIKERGLLEVLRGEVKWYGAHFRLMITKPAMSINEAENSAYLNNRFSITQELVYKTKNDPETGGEVDGGRGDLTIFLNGLPIIWIELKSNASGQNITNAKNQYVNTRNPEDLVFKYKQGCLLYFAMDLEDVAFTTRINGIDTYFMPYNKGVDMHKGNPRVDNDIKTSYMWNEILTKENILEWISNYIIHEVKEEKGFNGKSKISDKIIFPRYHQFNEVSRIVDDVKNKGVNGQNYLIMDSPGSGKTYSIAWLAHHLCSLHDASQKSIYDTIIVMTDRLVVDGQLQKAIMLVPHTIGTVEVMNKDCTSADLAKALNSGTRIIVSSVQKFSFILEKVKPLSDKSFAIIIDECHSSTKGSYLANAKKALSQEEARIEDTNADNEDDQDKINEAIEDDITKSGKQKNITFFGFSATPKKKTLELFGTKVASIEKGGMVSVPFTTYSMQQAIEEGFILDVLTNYTTYETYFQINKLIKDNPEYEKTRTSRAIYKYAMLHPTNIAQKIEIIIEHFRDSVEYKLNGTAKAMVITDSREGAVRYKKAFDKYLKDHNIVDIQALVAFTGTLKLKETGDKSYSEESMNGAPESQTEDLFNTSEYQVLLVANKYQTGYDQPLLCAMYVDKVLKGINAVQTLGRLNRKIPGKDEVFILDFRNSYEDIKKAFEPYYADLHLVGETDPNKIYKLESLIDSYHLVNDHDLDLFIKISIKDARTDADKQMWYSLLGKAKTIYDGISSEEEKDKLRKAIKQFVEGYSWIIQVTIFKDETLHKKSIFYKYLSRYLATAGAKEPIDVSSIVEIEKVRQKKTGENVGKPGITPTTEVKVGSVNSVSSKHDDIMVRIDELIKEMNDLFGAGFDSTSQSGNVMQLLQILLNDSDIEIRALNNKESDFELFLQKKLDDILVKGQGASENFYNKVLDNIDLKKALVDFLTKELYSKIRDKK